MSIRKAHKNPQKVFLEIEKKEKAVSIKAVAKEPSAIFAGGAQFKTLQGTTMMLLVLTFGDNGYGTLRPATREELPK